MLARHNLGAAPAPVWRPGAPRRAFWALLTGALVLSLALPLVTLWRVSASGLAARACMWPAEPRAGALAQALVVVPASVSLASGQGDAPAVHVVATMPDMAMLAEEASVEGPPRHLQGATVFMTPITVSMPGSWVVHITVRAAGQPVWHDTVTFHARASGWDALPLSTQSAGAAQLCAASPPVAAGSRSPPGAAHQPPMAEQVTAWLR